MPTRLRDNLRALRARIDAAAARVGRPAGAVRLVAVTKSVEAQTCAELAGLGQLELGESRAQALAPKARLCERAGLAVRWHFIGHLQRNKARAVVRAAAEIHSVDSPRLLSTLERLAGEEDRRLRAYLEVDFGASSGRTGLSPTAVPALVSMAGGLRHVELAGLMTMAPIPDETATDPLRGAREVFARLAELRERLPSEAFAGGRALLSMGMSSDLELAIEAGADLVRVGSALFEGLEVARARPGGGAR